MDYSENTIYFVTMNILAPSAIKSMCVVSVVAPFEIVTQNKNQSVWNCQIVYQTMILS